MYSLLCRHARITAISPELSAEGAAPEGAKAGASCALQRVQRSAVGRLLERNRGAQKALLGVVLLGTAMMFCDGVLSPAASGKHTHCLAGIHAFLRQLVASSAHACH